MSLIEEFKHLKISVGEIKLATDNFGDNNHIGKGGFGHVYKGELSHSEGRSMVAIKRLDRSLGQGNPEFWKEIMMLSHYRHENLISLLGFCDEGRERILVYEYALHRSLDCYLSNPSLTWLQRLKICVGAARGLEYLHNPKGTQQRVLHRDIKSSNILLDESWNAKISDFGLSKLGPANQQCTILVSNVAGTFGYIDPLYWETGILTNKSDVYSFGVVLFEVLCGRLCCEKYDGELRVLVHEWQHSYKEDKLEKIIFDDLRKQIAPNCLLKFSAIAYNCLRKDRKERPTMSEVVEALEIALDFQECFEDVEPPDYEEVAKMAEPPMVCETKEELHLLLSKGILLNNGKTWFSWKNNGQSSELISATNFYFQQVPEPKSRFSMAVKLEGYESFIAKVRTQFLTPGFTYGISLVLDYRHMGSSIIPEKCMLNSTEMIWAGIKYNQKTTKELKACIAYRREDGWLTVDLYQFTSHRKKVDFEISFQIDGDNQWVLLEGIEFRRIQDAGIEETEELDNANEIEIQSSTLDSDWEKKLPSNYRKIIKRAKDKIGYTTKSELYLRLSRGIFIKKSSRFNIPYWGKGDPHGYQWLWLDANGGVCLMLQSREVFAEQAFYPLHGHWMFHVNSRFSVVARFCNYQNDTRLRRFEIHCKIESEILSPETNYACHLVYQHVGNDYLEMPVLVKDVNRRTTKIIYLKNPTTAVIKLKQDQRSQYDLISVPKPKMEGHPKKRNDGWMEVQAWEFKTGTASHTSIKMDMEFHIISDGKFDGLTVEGIEFRPI